jgi:MFS family permease
MAQRDSYRGWWVVAVSAVGLSVSAGTVVVYAFAVFLKPLTQEFHWNRSQVSLAVSLLNLMVCLGSPAAGRLVDRLGGRVIILPSIALLGATLVSLRFLSAHLWHLYLLYSIAGLVGLGATSLTYSRVVAGWFDHRRGFALGVTSSGIGLGSFVMPPLAQAVIGAAGWRQAYMVLGIVVFLVPLPLVALLLRDAPAALKPAPHERTHSSGDALRTRAFWQMVVQFFVVSACVNGAMAHLSALLTDRGTSAQAAAFAISVFGASAFVGRIMTGYLVDRFFAPYVMVALFGGAAVALLLLAGGATGMLSSLAAVLMGFGVGAEADVMPYLVSRYFGLKALGELFGYIFSAYTLGVATGPVLMGAGFDSTGSYKAPLTGLAIALIGATAATLTLPRYPKPVQKARAE